MARINTNISALRAITQTGRNHNDLNLRLERLSTGLRINRGRDDPAGIIISELLRSEIRGIDQAIANGARAANVISTAEGALNEVSALLLELQSLIVSTSNEAGLIEDEVRANQQQVDSILASIDRVVGTTTFAGERLIDGSKAYTLSGVPAAALASVAVYGAFVPENGTRGVEVQVTQSAQTGQISFIGATAGGISYTSAATIELRGTLGTELLTFASGTTLADVRDTINTVTALTGVSAVISSPGIGSIASAVLLNTATLGSGSFVSVTALAGNFVVNGNNNIENHDAGIDAGVLINGQTADVKGVRADVRSNRLDLRVYLTQTFAQTLSSASFTITGGGSIFQVTPDVTPNGQLHVGLESVATTHLGNSVIGYLYEIHSGSPNDLASRNYSTAKSIVAEAINQVASYRGRLGSIQRNSIERSINSQSITLENVTASESVIRDADMAEEVAALTRAQILVQSSQSTLQIANNIPNLVLSLLG